MVDPIAWYDEIREKHRVVWHPETSSWYVTRFDDVWGLLVDNRLGARSTDTFTDKMTPDQRLFCSPLVDFVSRWPVFSDMPRHTTVHKLILPAFASAETQRITAAVRAHVNLEKKDVLGSADALDVVVRQACKVALAEFLGLALDELDRIPKWSRKLIAFVGQGEEDYDARIVAEANVALTEFSEFVARVCGRGSSVLSATMQKSMADGEFELADAVAVYGQMVTGFLQPTMSSLALAIAKLTEGTEFRRNFDTDPDTFISESIRLASPFHFAPRRALEKISIDGQEIPEGDRVVLLLVAANRDARRFQDPLTFRMDRGRPPHVAFARGRYACLGATLARQAMGIVLSAVRDSAFGEFPAMRVKWNVSWGMRMAEGLIPATI